MVVLVVTLLVFSVFSSIEKHQTRDVIKNQKGAVVFLLVFLETFSFTTCIPTFSPAPPCVGLLQCTGAHSKAPKQQEVKYWTTH